MGPYKNFTDVELVATLKTDDKTAFAEIYDRYWDKLFSIAGHKLDQLEDAEEVVQNIFISLWNRRATLNITSTLNSYLAVSVKYRVIKVLEKQYHQRKYADSLGKQQGLDDSTQEWLEFTELKAQLERLVRELPDKCQLVYRMSREDGFSQKEIAGKLDISEKTVEAHLGKAIKTIRAGLNTFISMLL
ncbi:RNA polymerase sigma-70 factor [Pedobacter nyackensis]|uniref:RNA polymerase sigma-70 factor, ECF subfamily n=1 Tax=Pedobacter nyackensis TaxID=475255 RepID=A0A1W1ZYW8_9SPHI|nr:RNA polymerase sigma-70 factor [Pedobacter nyackensis]SMC53583.1 RNA polymerase sigma-70 factor, ECF subfamily [Pedobacter nyackensis]